MRAMKRTKTEGEDVEIWGDSIGERGYFRKEVFLERRY